MLRPSYTFLFVIFAILMCVSPAHAQNLLAFPTAEGFGRFAKGGRGGRVIEVTNLNCSGPGSLRAALEASGPRTVVFRTGGTIDCSAGDIMWIRNPYVTIAGQTAPGDGILLKGCSTGVTTHDVIIRHMRFRLGNEFAITSSQHPDSAGSLIILGEGGDVIFDHISVSWGQDDMLGFGAQNSTTSTVQWSIVAEGIHCGRKSNCQGKGISGGGVGVKASLLHNLIANTADRNPLIGDGYVDVINNVIHNVGGNSMVVGSHYAPFRGNIVGNYFSIGPLTQPYQPIRLVGGNVAAGGAPRTNEGLIYFKGNIQPVHRPNDTLPELKLVMNTNGPPSFPISKNRIPTTDYPSETTAVQARTDVLAGAGDNKRLNADGTWTSRRGTIDTRIINEVKTGTGTMVRYSPNEVGGYAQLASGTAYADTDKDGMSDIWEKKHGFNPKDATDRNFDSDEDGYTNLEEFLNGTSPGMNVDTPPATPQNITIK